jgi:hypothetical protein
MYVVMKTQAFQTSTDHRLLFLLVVYFYTFILNTKKINNFNNFQVLRDNLSVQDLSLKDFAQPVKMAHVQLGDKLM